MCGIVGRVGSFSGDNRSGCLTLKIPATMVYINLMKHIFAIGLAAMMWAAPVAGQEKTQQMQDGFNLLEEGMGLLLQGLIQELGPKILELEGKVIDLNAYEFPEVLPNGDIIIRRKIPLDPSAEGQTDL